MAGTISFNFNATDISVRVNVGTEIEDDNSGSDLLLDAMIVWGSEEKVGDVIQAHFAAGADHVAIQAFDPAGSPLPCQRARAACASS